jgi:hypothetical protein
MDPTPDKTNDEDSSKDSDERHTRFVVLNMGRQKRNKIKKLERGKGVLADAVTESIEKMRCDGTLKHHLREVVVVVVKEKRKRNRIPFLGSY